MKDYAKVLYKSQAWKDCRAAYYKSKGGLCELCLAKGLYSSGEIVHHKIHINEDNVYDTSVTMNFNNLQLLCRNCHAKQHSGKRYTVDEFGRVIF